MIEEFIRLHGVTHCPTTIVLPSEHLSGLATKAPSLLLYNVKRLKHYRV
jgi:hypothetical protein